MLLDVLQVNRSVCKRATPALPAVLDNEAPAPTSARPDVTSNRLGPIDAATRRRCVLWHELVRSAAAVSTARSQPSEAALCVNESRRKLTMASGSIGITTTDGRSSARACFTISSIWSAAVTRYPAAP